VGSLNARVPLRSRSRRQTNPRVVTDEIGIDAATVLLQHHYLKRSSHMSKLHTCDLTGISLFQSRESIS